MTPLALSACAGDESSAATAGSPSIELETPRPTDSAPEQATPSIEMGAPAEFDMTSVPRSMEPGKVTFEVTNDGTIEHEVLVMGTERDSGALATNSDGSAIEEGVVEPAAPHGDGDHHRLHVQAGEQAMMTVDLTPGEYALVCNLPGHYESGMHANLTVAS